MGEDGQIQKQPTRQLVLDFDDFAWSAIAEESLKLGVSVEDLAHFAVLYYLADLDSGRIARRIDGALSLQDV